jgi:putative ABC transport system permease protein
VRFQGEVPEGFPGRFREIAAGVDPTIQLRRVTLLSDFYGQLRSFWRYVTWAVGLITLSVLLLSAAGIYALMSFTVAQRTREIGIRTALGAHPRRILLNVFGRVTMQLVVGVLLGSLLAGGVFSSLGLVSCRWWLSSQLGARLGEDCGFRLARRSAARIERNKIR